MKKTYEVEIRHDCGDGFWSTWSIEEFDNETKAQEHARECPIEHIPGNVKVVLHTREEILLMSRVNNKQSKTVGCEG